MTERKVEGRAEVTGRQGRRRKKPPDDFKERREYCELKEESPYRTLWRAALEESMDLS
jgi:hypothetical protein